MGRVVWLACVGLIAASPLSAQELKLRETLKGHTDIVFSVAFSPDGKTLASASLDNRLSCGTWPPAEHRHSQGAFRRCLFRWRTAQTVRPWFREARTRRSSSGMRLPAKTPPLSMETQGLLSVAFSPDGKTLASGDMRRRSGCGMWPPARTGDPQGHPPVSSVAFSPDGKTLASGAGMTIKLWDVATGTNTATHNEQLRGSKLRVAFSPDGKVLASGSWDKTVNLWDLKPGEKADQ